MPLWFRKLVVVLITVFTLGLVTPPAHFLTENDNATSKADLIKSNSDNNDDDTQHNIDFKRTGQQLDYHLPWPEIASSIPDKELDTQFLDYTKYHANQQTMLKFGNRIQNRLAEEYMQEISPKIEQEIASYFKGINEETIRNLAITDNPSSGYGEKIFHIYDVRDGSDQFRVHVRREHPPKDGYYFSFHYHTAKDEFQSHHQLGKLYWDKNMPPKWMA